MRKRDLEILIEDIQAIKESLENFESYDFVADVWHHMDKLKLSNNALAKRVLVSHTMVNKWLTQHARPHGKERMKELGMALGMNASELNDFLYANCYTRLYIKNPLDTACKMLLRTSSGAENIVKLYRSILEVQNLKDYLPPSDRVDIATAVLSQNFCGVSTKGFESWLEHNDKYFGASAKTQLPNQAIISFILLYLGQEKIYKLYSAELLPVAVKDLLYPLLSGKEVAVRGLRHKLIAFGLFMNMSEEEIDILLNYAKLRLLSEPRTKLDCVILTGVRCAHERYPYFEYANMIKLTNEISQRLEASQSSQEQDALRSLYDFYYARMQNLANRVDYYNKHKNKEDLLFKERYAEYRMIQYISDILNALETTGILSDAEAKEFIALIDVYEK